MTAPVSLPQLYRRLDVPREKGLSFTAVDLPGTPALRLGRSLSGPALLIPLHDVDEQSSSIELKNLAVLPNVTCRTHGVDGTTEGLFTVCMCTTEDARLQALFLDALQCVLPASAAGASVDARSAVEGLIELFSGLQRAPATSIIGLWGELFVMHSSAEPDQLLDAWHQLPTDHYDFARGAERLEVKTTVGRRQHSFSLNQLTPPAGVDVVIASTVTESSAAGLSVLELITATAARCHAADAAARLLSGAAKALGADVQHWSAQRYDMARAQDSLRLFPAPAIPRPSAEHAAISDVRFRVDLESIEADVPEATAVLARGLLA